MAGLGFGHGGEKGRSEYLIFNYKWGSKSNCKHRQHFKNLAIEDSFYGVMERSRKEAETNETCAQSAINIPLQLYPSPTAADDIMIILLML
jgi:hypothetical protein